MYRLQCLLLCALFTTSAGAQSPTEEELSYALGLMVGANMTEQLQAFGVELKLEDLTRGFNDGFGHVGVR